MNRLLTPHEIPALPLPDVRSGWKADASALVLGVRHAAPPVTLAIILVLGGCDLTPLPPVAKFPVNDEGRAISIAKYVCRREAGPEFQWEAHWVAEKSHWIVDTEPSLHKSGDPLWMVDIPIDGPLPKRCWRSFYDIITPTGTLTTFG